MRPRTAGTPTPTPSEGLDGMIAGAGLPLSPRELAEPISRNSHRERLLASMARSCARKGFNATTTTDIVEGAKVSRATFYELFKDKEDCLHAAMELAVAEAASRVVPAYSADKPWATNVRNVVAAFLQLLAERPAYARMALVEARASGDRAAELYASSKQVAAALLDHGRGQAAESGQAPSSASRAALAAAESLITGQILSGNAERLPELLPDIVYITTIAYLGREEALAQYEAAERSLRKKAAGNG
jgi:AcrR family transcriptional regulator